MANLWNKSSGSTLVTLPERQTTVVNLPLVQADSTVTLIAGNLPKGMRLQGSQLLGTPLEVPRETTYEFVLRATYQNVINDRTYKIIVQGADEPAWITKEDLLPVGISGQYFILDSAPIDFQLEAIDQDTSAGQKLEYFMGNRDGELPPGITLTTDGKLVGIVDPILAIEKAQSAGKFDDSPYDFQSKSGYDWSVRPNNGYDSYFYDTTIYGLSVPTTSPKKLNRYYQFTVNVSDGDSIIKRKFRIYVVGDDFFRADTTVMQVGAGSFTADISHLRTPIWITPRDFGYRRANNYVTLKLDIIDPNTLVGLVSYNLSSKNDDDTDSILPPGLTLDATTGEIAGYTPYLPAVTQEYKFTVNARRIEVDQEKIQFQQFAFEATPKNTLNIKVNKLGEFAQRAVNLEFSLEGYAYKVLSIITGDTEFDVLNLDKPIHKALIKGDTIDLGTISVLQQEIAEKKKTFTVKLLGEVDSTIKWITPENLGSISSNFISTLNVVATTTVPNAVLLYSLESGSLPPGLSLSFDGEIIGKINSFGTTSNKGLTVFDSQGLIIDGNTTSIDRKFQFNIKAQDQFGYSAIQRNFEITVADPDDKLYSNIYAQPYMKESLRADYTSIINDAEIFDSDYIYRPNDPNFGLQRKIKMLIYAGIETTAIQNYVAAASKNHKKKKLIMGNIKTAVAKTPGTNDVVYEVVYVEVIDPANPKKGKTKNSINIANKKETLVNSIKFTPKDELYDATPNTFKIGTRDKDVTVDFGVALNLYLRDVMVNQAISSTLLVNLRNEQIGASVPFSAGTPISNKYRPVPENTITIDSNAITVDGAKDQTRYISNISNMRDRLRNVGETERNFLPLWMRTAQEDSVNELGYVTAIPLVYCKPGKSKIIKNSLDFYNTKFTQYNFEMDRYIIDSTLGNSEEQFILFANYNFNV